MGLIELKIKGRIIEGTFHNRRNRFIAEVSIRGTIEIAHVPNTGRMSELLIKGARVLVREVDSVTRKTKFDLLMVYYGDTLVAIDSRMPNNLLHEGFLHRTITSFSNYHEVKREVTYRNSRFDIGLVNQQGGALIEAKCVTLVEDGLAKFPDAPTERGKRHVEELKEAIKDGFEAGVFFIIQRKDAKLFRPHWEMDPKFSMALKEAKEMGVVIKAITCDVKPHCINLYQEIKLDI